jgi:uncharacterized protein (TIGR02001 family)
MRVLMVTAGACACLVTSAAGAQTPSPWSGSLGLMTDYVRRGSTRGKEEIEATGSLEYTRGAFYAGTAANTAAVGDSDYEVDLYVGYQPTWAGWDMDLNAKCVSYFSSSGDVDHWEFYAQGTRSVGPLTVVALIGGSPDYEGAADEAHWANANLAWALTPKLSADVGGGFQDQKGAPDYGWWQAGITYAFTPSIGGDLHWYDTDNAAALGESGDGQLVAAISWAF